MTSHNETIASRTDLFIGCLLLLLLAVTRSGITRSHFGTSISLPDASWAVFWLAGALTFKRHWPVLLLFCCVAVDYFVIAGGVSADCFTPAYPFLIPAYLSLWWAGRQLRPYLHSKAVVPYATLSLLLSVTTCFIISNLGFYLAGYTAKMSALAYAQTVLRYWPHYLQTAALYAGTGLLIYHIARHLPAVRMPRSIR